MRGSGFRRRDWLEPAYRSVRGCLQGLFRQFSAKGSLDGLQGPPQGRLTSNRVKGEGAMGELIDLAQRREAVHRTARRREPLRAQLFFDLACPFSYLAAERVERAFAHVAWTAASSETLQRRCLADDPESVDRVRA